MSSATFENGTKIAASSSPACTFSMRVLSSTREIHSTPSSLTRSACQKFGFFLSMTRSPRFHSTRLNAPDAIGFLGIGFLADRVDGLFRDDRDARHGERRQERRRLGWLSVTTRVLSSLASADLDHLVGVGPQRALVVADARQREGRVLGGDRRAILELRVAHLERIDEAIAARPPSSRRGRARAWCPICRPGRARHKRSRTPRSRHSARS